MIPIVDLQAQYQRIKPEIERAVLSVLESTQFVLGNEVAQFEKEFAAYCGVRYAVGVNSGTSALHLALLSAGAGPGDEVITVPFTFVATVAAADYTGARAVLVDIDENTCAMDPALVERAITPRTKAILPVHLYGQPADMNALREIAHRHHLLLIEDAAQAHGAEYQGRRCGSFGDLACFSFYPTKNLGTCGEGGIVLTGSEEHAQRLLRMRDWGQAEKYHHVMKGFNYRMEGIQGAVLRVKLRYLEQWTEARRAHARCYNELLAPLGIEVPRQAPGTRHVFHVYSIRVAADNRDRIQKSLHEQGIQTAIHYPIPIHVQPAFAHLGYRPGQFPVAERLAKRVLSLPMYPEMTNAQIQEVADAVRRAL